MNYTLHMNFEWDEAKSNLCYSQRGFDFAYAVRAFLIPIESCMPIPGESMVKSAIS